MVDRSVLPAWTVDGAPVSADDVVPRWPNYGQRMRQELPAVPYVLVVSFDSVVDALQEDYASFAAEVQAEMGALPPNQEDDAMWRRMAQAGWPDLRRLMTGDFPLFVDLVHYTLEERLLWAYARDAEGAGRYVVNAVSHLEQPEVGTIVVRGDCYVDPPLSAISGAYRRSGS